MSYINKDATLAAIANKAKAELADANHYFLEGVQLAVDVVEGMTEPKEVENGSMSCPDARKSHDRTTDDCISRQAAIEKLRNNLPYMQAFGVDRSIVLINELPSAQPEHKRGKWVEARGSWYTPGGDPVWECSECGKGRHVYGIEHGSYGSDVADGQWVSCPNCGADMLEVDE